IHFGDLNDENSAIAKLRSAEAEGRNYFVLEEIGVKPTVSYLTKVRNRDESALSTEHMHEERHIEHKHEGEKHEEEKAHS
ncbi:MAG: hypothetical protein M3R27_16185, partial [Bacteroidota bacterium]|nr:hypothetical protein [Bacteroidota bacterium]